MLDKLVTIKPELKHDANNLKTIVSGYKSLKVTDEARLDKIKTRVMDLAKNVKKS